MSASGKDNGSGAPEGVENIRDAVARLSREEKKRSRRKKDAAPKPIDMSADATPDIPVEVEQAIMGRVERRRGAVEGSAEPAVEVTPSPQAPPEQDAPLLDEALRRAEAILFATDAPVAAADLATMLPPGADVADVLMRLRKFYTGRGVTLAEVAGGWRFQTAPDLAFLFEETREEERRLSKAALETLAIIAYCQPVTRAEIEDVRGVAVSKGTLDVLMEMKWVRMRGRRRTPGRPVTYGTTDAFLEHFGLESLDAMPGRDDMKAAGLLSSAIPEDFDMPRPSDSDADEDLLDAPDQEMEHADFHTDFMDE